MVAFNYLAAAAAAVAVFVFAGGYYSILAGQVARLSAAGPEQPGSLATTMAFELVKSLVLALVIAGLVKLLDIRQPLGAAGLALALWIAFPVLLLAGSVIHERVPWRLAAIHAGDWLAKLVIIALIVAVWP